MKKIYLLIIIIAVIIVIVGAILIWQDKNRFSDWKTYQNEEYGFELKYPVTIEQEIKVFLMGDSIELRPKGHWEPMGYEGWEPTRLEILVSDFKDSIPLKNYLIERYNKKQDLLKPITIGGIEGYSLVTYQEDTIYIIEKYLIRDSKLYKFICFGEVEFINTCNQILSTFKFILQPSYNKITIDQLKNTEYELDDKTYRLKDGLYSGEVMQGIADAAEPVSFTIELQEDKISFGDLNGDSKDDAIAITWHNIGGGSGTYIVLSGFINKDGTSLFVASKLLGDRVIINSISIKDKVIVVDMVIHGPNDGMCCPSLKQIKKFELSENSILEVY